MINRFDKRIQHVILFEFIGLKWFYLYIEVYATFDTILFLPCRYVSFNPELQSLLHHHPPQSHAIFALWFISHASLLLHKFTNTDFLIRKLHRLSTGLKPFYHKYYVVNFSQTTILLWNLKCYVGAGSTCQQPCKIKITI